MEIYEAKEGIKYRVQLLMYWNVRKTERLMIKKVMFG